MLLFDGHLDLSMNAIDWNRDLNLDVHELRVREAGMAGKGRGLGTVTLPELRRADVGVCMATVIRRTARPATDLPGYEGAASQEVSYGWAQGQLAYYRVLAAQGKVRLIADRDALDDHAASWLQDPQHTPLGFILAMEGADPIVWPEQAESWWADGLRVVGPAHYGVSAYAHGTGTEGGFTEAGRRLLAVMDALGMILDLSHLAEPAFWEALDLFHGPVLASHNNCRPLVPGDRQYSDEQLRAIVARGGVVGAVLDAWMLYPGWVRGVTTPAGSGVTLDAVVDHIDHVCQVAGNADHAAIGSDLDGGYGTEQTPRDVDTIFDLQRIPQMLRARGYAEQDVEKIMYRNWLDLFRRAWS
jgi:membrane dipeptidase